MILVVGLHHASPISRRTEILIDQFCFFQTATEVSEGELCIDVENIMSTESGVNDIDKPSTQCTSLVSTFSCVTCNVNFKTKNDLITHIAECNKQGV